jgi:hypothetical protein
VGSIPITRSAPQLGQVDVLDRGLPNARRQPPAGLAGVVQRNLINLDSPSTSSLDADELSFALIERLHNTPWSAIHAMRNA